MAQPEDTVQTAYDLVADDYARLLPDTRAETALDLAVLDAFVARVRDEGDVLDAGCGAGRMARHLADRGCTVRGVDLSPRMIAAGHRAHPDLDLTVASLADLPFEDGRFAGVMAWYSTIHTPDEELPGVLAELVRVLRPGGHLLVAFQAGEGVVDLAESYGRHGHDVVLERYRRRVDAMAHLLDRVGCQEVVRMVRAPKGNEAEDQAVMLVRRR
ncbi:ubiquinone biosynthesis protein [Ornithinimicrobium sp. CNJ-824]|uniref:class I SAM-dependent methyltransferase n=1 Tax=Ornithinimicrobium sp. CNJ-824 TaxID=1904966 RepID=UPI0009671AEB|nr:class I SAM-dependent methyltransferase [Ornithinimicrobium sp. CNJ-824]OLT21952.1 ubiquinone biosynthesis protein [Ornithinimicrobium sp. CNJ-824]